MAMRASNLFNSNNNFKNILYVYNLDLGKINIHDKKSKNYTKTLYSKEKFTKEELLSMSGELIKEYGMDFHPDKYGCRAPYLNEFIKKFTGTHKQFSTNRGNYFIISDFNKYKKVHDEVREDIKKYGPNAFTLSLQEDDITEHNMSIIDSVLDKLYDLTRNDEYEIDIDWEKLKNILFSKYNMYDEEVIEIDISNLFGDAPNYCEIAVISSCDIVPEDSVINKKDVEVYRIPERCTVASIFRLTYNICYTAKNDHNLLTLYLSKSLKCIKSKLPFYQNFNEEGSINIVELDLEQIHKPSIKIDFNLSSDSFEDVLAVKNLLYSFGDTFEKLNNAKGQINELLRSRK